MSLSLGLRYLSDLHTGQTSSSDEYSPIRRSSVGAGAGAGGALVEPGAREGVDERAAVRGERGEGVDDEVDWVRLESGLARAGSAAVNDKTNSQSRH